MTAGQVRDMIRTVLCKGVTAEQADQIVRALIPSKVGAGHAVLREGDRPSGLFLLVKGTVEVHAK